MDLLRKSASGAAIMGTVRTVSQVIAIGTSFYLARLLTPEEFGLFAMVAPIMATLGFLVEMGLTSAAIQKKDLTPGESSLLFWASLGAGLLLGAAVTAAAGQVAAFYGRPELRPLVMGCSISLPIAALLGQPRALLSREMRFRAIALGDLGATLVGSAAGIVGGVLGWGPWALLAMAIAPSLFLAGVLWAASGFRPVRPTWGPGGAAMFRFAVNLSAYRFLDQLAANLDAVIVGRACGAAPLGYYSRARKLTQNPIVRPHTTLATVMVPALSRLQDEPGRLGVAFLRTWRAMAAITFPVACWLFVLSPEAILLAYGPQWGPAVPIFRVLCLVALFDAPQRALEWVYVSTGRSDRLLRWTMISAPSLCLSYVVGARWGASGVAVAFAATWALLLVPATWYALKTVDLGLVDGVRYLGPPLVVSVLAAAATWGLLQALLPDANALVPRAIVGTALMAALYTGLVWLLARDLTHDMRHVVRSLARRGPGDPVPAAHASDEGTGREA